MKRAFFIWLQKIE
uniref:Uncharacterized protein n=1 Tax=Rhizophora mucronata TaxID=61149 RepID=A0A2P2QHZ1_RHIMU